MTRDTQQYRDAARLIAEADDPRLELLRVARLASAAARQRKRLQVGASVLGLLLAALAIWRFAAGDDARVPPAATVDLAAEGAWVEGLFVPGEDAAPVDEAGRERLLAYMQEPAPAVERKVRAWLDWMRAEQPKRKLTDGERSRLRPLLYCEAAPESQRFALLVLTNAGEEIGEERLLWFLRNPQPATLSVALTAIWYHAARHGTFPDPAGVEEFALNGEHNERIQAIYALTSMKNYVPSKRLMESIRSGDRGIREAGQGLLERGEH